MNRLWTLKKNALLLAAVLFFTLTATALGQDTKPAPKASADDNFAETTAFKNRVFEIKYRDPNNLYRALIGLASGFKGASMNYNDEFRTLTVRDFPENLATIEEALKRLDKPEPPRPTIEFHIHILIASEGTAPAGQEYPEELADVLKQLRSTLKYKSYVLLASSIQRTKEGREGVSNSGSADGRGLGIADSETYPIAYHYDLGQISLEGSGGALQTIAISGFKFSMRIYIKPVGWQDVGFHTPVSLRDGEKIVVGTTTVGDRGVAVVVTAKLIK